MGKSSENTPPRYSKLYMPRFRITSSFISNGYHITNGGYINDFKVEDYNGPKIERIAHRSIYLGTTYNLGTLDTSIINLDTNIISFGIYTLLETNWSMRRHFNVEYSYQTDYMEILDAV